MSTRRNFQNSQRTKSVQNTTSSGNTQNGDEEIVNIMDVKDQAVDFYTKYQKIILGVAAGLVLVVGGYLAYKYLYKQPREKEAITASYQAQIQFARDSFQAALKNPGGNFEGFEAIADNYSGTNAGNIAKFYAGVCNLNLGKYDEAISFLEDYSPNDEITPGAANAALGDAYAEKGDLEKAESYYEKAASSDNDFSGPFYLNKLGLLQFSKKKNDAALATFKKIMEKYPASMESRDAEKMIERLSK
jgi:tetratricopeptide (TPR) repeat protein